jgi:hypothetical protein
MPGSGKYTQYQPDDVSSGKKLVLSDQKLLSRAYATRPVQQSAENAVAQTAIVAAGNQFQFPPTQAGDPTYFPNGVNLQFQGIVGVVPGAPTFKDVKTGGGGAPSTPWTPNIASPGEGNGADPTKQPDLAIGYANASMLNKTAQESMGGMLVPKDNSLQVGTNTKLTIAAGTLPLGGHPGGSGPQFV